MTTTRETPASVHSSARHTGFIILAAISFGTVPFFAKGLTEAGMAPSTVAFCRYGISALLLLPFLKWRDGAWTMTVWGIVAGVIMGVGWIGYVRALDVIPVSTAGVIYMTYPVFTVLISWLVFREAPRARAWLAAGIIVAAAMIASSPAAIGTDAFAALAWALFAPFGFGLGINVLTHKLVGLPPLSRNACVLLGAAAGLLPLIASAGFEQAVPDTLWSVVLILGIAFVTGFVPQLLYVISAPRIGAARTAMAGSIELPTMFIVGWLAFGETITSLQMIAGAMVVAAIVISPSKRVRNVSTQIATLERRGHGQKPSVQTMND